VGVVLNIVTVYRANRYVTLTSVSFAKWFQTILVLLVPVLQGRFYKRLLKVLRNVKDYVFRCTKH